MKKQLIKSAAIIVLVFLFGNVQAQVKCDNFGKRHHKGRTSIYKAVDLGDQEKVTRKTKSELLDISAIVSNDTKEDQILITKEEIIASIKDGKESKIFIHSLKRSEKRECNPFK